MNIMSTDVKRGGKKSSKTRLGFEKKSSVDKKENILLARLYLG